MEENTTFIYEADHTTIVNYKNIIKAERGPYRSRIWSAQLLQHSHRQISRPDYVQGSKHSTSGYYIFVSTIERLDCESLQRSMND